MFERAFTVMSHMLRAHVSLLTGVHLLALNVLSNTWIHNGLIQTLAERGYTNGRLHGGTDRNFHRNWPGNFEKAAATR